MKGTTFLFLFTLLFVKVGYTQTVAFEKADKLCDDNQYILTEKELISLLKKYPKEKDWGKWRILIAEDNDSYYSLVKHILKEYQITRVVNGVEAVDKVRNDKFDMKIPIMGGLEATRKIRELNPIISLTTNAFDVDRINAIETGCNSYLTKPLKKRTIIRSFFPNKVAT